MNEDRLNADQSKLSFTGFPTFLRLPHHTDPHQLDVAIVGVPFDAGTLYKNGTRFGPREIRAQSSLIRGYNPVLQMNPTEKYRVADFGDINASPFSLEKAFQSIDKGS